MILKLSLFWFAYFAGLGAFFPFFGLFLQQELHLSPGRVGLVMATIPWVGLMAQPLWGRAADRTGSRRLTLAFTITGAALLYAVLGLLPAFWPIFVGTAVLACFSTIIVPMGTAVSLACLDDARDHGSGVRFGYVRMWGTVGFLLSVAVLPMAMDSLQRLDIGPWHGLGWMFPFVALWTLAGVPWILTLPATRGLDIRSQRGDTRRLLRHGPVFRLLIFVFLAHLCMQAPIQLFPLLITDRGGDADAISTMWIFMLLVEIPLIGFSGPSLRRIGARGLLALGMIVEGVRWLSTAFIADFEIFRWIQLSHGVGVAGIFVGAALYLEQSVPERSRATGQSMVATMAGLGAIVSLAGGGWLFEQQGAEVPYIASGLAALLLGLATYRLLPTPHRPTSTIL